MADPAPIFICYAGPDRPIAERLHDALRDGPCFDSADRCRSAHRDWQVSGHQLDRVGLRLVRPAPAV